MAIFSLLGIAVLAYIIFKIIFPQAKPKNDVNEEAENEVKKMKVKAKEERNKIWQQENNSIDKLYFHLGYLLSRAYPEKEKQIVIKKLKKELIDSEHNLDRLNELSDEIKMLRECNVEELAEYYFNKAERDTKYGKILYLRNYYGKAIDLVKKPIYYNNRGCIYHQRNLFEFAINDYNEAINLDPEFGQYYYNRGGAYFSLDKREEARNDWQKASELGIEEAENMLKVHFNNFFI